MDLRAATLVAVVCCCLGTPSAAVADGAHLQTQAASSTAPPTDKAALARELDEVRALQARLQQRAEDPAAGPLVEDQRNLAARLALLLTAQLEPSTPFPKGAVVAPAPALGAPPHPADQVDALRDRIDVLAKQRRSFELSARALESQVAGLVNALRKSEELVRLRQDQIAQARETAPRERLQGELDVARLESRIAALELTRADAARAEARARAAAMAERLEPDQRALERARMHQVIDDALLQQVADSVRAARRQLQADRQRASARLVQAEAAGIGQPADGAAAREVLALRGALAALTELDPIEAGREEVWRQRRLALAAMADPAQREQATAVLGRSVDQLSARAQATADRLTQVRDVLRSERLRVEALPAGDADLPAERRALEARQREADALEAVEERLQRLQRLLERSLDDLGASVAAVPVAWHQRAWSALQQGAQRLWRYELFSVSESTLVEGRSVTVDYGVTVGKSVGVVLLFLTGWWVASRLSGALIGLAVRKMLVSAQLGRVIHRWVLTLLLFGVLIVVLKLARIPLTVFAFLGGALAIGVGFGTQNIIRNLICGVIILFERKVRVGDIVTIDGVSGTVSSVDLRATTLRGFDGIDAIVPNSLLLENRVNNWSHGSPTVRRAITVGLRYGDDARAASACLLACALDDAGVLRVPAPEVLFDDFGADAQQLRLQYWMRLGEQRSGPRMDSDLRHAITEAFASLGLTMASPQLEVQLQDGMPAARRHTPATTRATGGLHGESA